MNWSNIVLGNSQGTLDVALGFLINDVVGTGFIQDELEGEHAVLISSYIAIVNAYESNAMAILVAVDVNLFTNCRSTSSFVRVCMTSYSVGLGIVWNYIVIEGIGPVHTILCKSTVVTSEVNGFGNNVDRISSYLNGRGLQFLTNKYNTSVFNFIIVNTWAYCCNCRADGVSTSSVKVSRDCSAIFYFNISSRISGSRNCH